MNCDVYADKPASDYREFRPSLPLANHLLCLWTALVIGPQGAHAHHVLPDGCIDIVLINKAPPVVVGPWTESFVARHAPGTRIVGARWYPGRAPAMLGLPASALLNQSVPLSVVWGSASSARFARIADEQSLSARKAAMEAALLDCLTHASPVDEAMNTAIQWLARNPHGRVEKLSQCIGISCRQLQRRFSSAVGYGPKMFQSVLRFQRLLNLAGCTSAPRNLAQFSADAGYADQAHMTREVQRFSGSPPSLLLQSAQSALRLSDFFETAPGRNQ